MKKKFIIVLIVLIIVVASILLIKTNNSKYEYEVTKVTAFEYFTLNSNEKQGVINKNGDVLIQPNYTNIIIPNPQKDIFFCYNDENVEVLNAKGEKIYKDIERVEPIKLKNVATTLNYEKSVFKFEKDGKYGLINLDGKVIVKNEYESIENLQLCEGIFLVKQNAKYGIMNLKGTIIVSPSYDNISSDGYYTKEDGYKKAGFIVSNKTDDGYRFGYITNTGKKYLDSSFNSVTRVWKSKLDNDIYLVVSQKGQYGLYKNKKKILNEEYQSIEFDENSDLLIIEKNKKYGVSTLDGKIIIEPENTNIETKGIYIYAKQSMENKVYDFEGNKINISFNKSIYETENENYKISTIENNDITYYGIVDKNGNTLVSEKYEYIEYTFGTYFIAKNENGKFGIIGSNGKEILEFKFSSLQKLKNKNILQAIDSKDETTTLYSSNLKVILSEKNANISNEEGYIQVKTDNNTIYLDSEGKELEPNDEIIKNSDNLKEPDRIGKYKKVQFTLENVYYVVE